MDTYIDQFGRKAIIRKIKCRPYKGAPKQEAYKVTIKDEIVIFLCITSTKQEALQVLQRFTDTWKQLQNL